MGRVNDRDMPLKGRINHPVVPAGPADNEGRNVAIDAARKGKVVHRDKIVQLSLPRNLLIERTLPSWLVKIPERIQVKQSSPARHQELRFCGVSDLQGLDERIRQHNIRV